MKAVVANCIWPVSSKQIRNGSILISDDGIITALQDHQHVPENYEIIRTDHVTPGMVCAHSGIGLDYDPRGRLEHSDLNENSDPFTPEVKAEDGFWPLDREVTAARQAGFTTIYVSFGCDNVIGGTGCAFSTAACMDPYEMMYSGSAQMTAAVGELPLSYWSERNVISDRASLFAMMADFLKKSDEYCRNSHAAYDAKLEAMKPVMNGQMLLHVHACVAGDMLAVAEMLKAYQIRCCFVTATESWKIADRLAQLQIPCILGPVYEYAYREELFGTRPDTGTILEKAGLKNIAFTFNDTNEIEFLRAFAGRRVAYGMSKQKVLEGLTIAPARILGLNHQIGTIEPGKNADLAFFNGEPLLNTTRCIGTMIRGVLYKEEGN